MMKTGEEKIRIKGTHYATGRGIELDVSGGFIERISEREGDEPGSNRVIIPGLIDNQTNGYYGINFADEFFTTERLKEATEFIWRDGVTSFVPTLVTNSHENFLRNFRILSKAADDAWFKGGIPGFHLEGPYLSPEPGFFGCHPSWHLRKPSWREFQDYQEAAGGRIIIVTISPELEGAMEFIRRCSDSGVLVSIGHTNATAEQIAEAVDNGARMSTHLGNGCANMINRHRNPLWPQLANDMLTPSIIADGHHLLPEEIKVFYKVKGDENLMLTSDVNHLIGMEPGDYVYMGSKVVMTPEGLVINPAINCLAGASLPLRKGVETMMAYTGCKLEQAVNMASRNVAKSLRLGDRGELSEGMRADLTICEINNNNLQIRETWVKGELVFSNQ